MDKEIALKILRELHDKALFSERTALETFIPELKESEDEKIRKALVRFHKSSIDIDGIKGEDILAWLEKQGEKPTIIDIDSMVSKYANTKEACTNGLPVNCQIRAYRQGINDVLRLSLNLEKQGEQETDEWKEGDIIRHGGIFALVIRGRRAMKSNGEIFTIQYPDEWVKVAPNEIEHFFICKLKRIKI